MHLTGYLPVLIWQLLLKSLIDRPVAGETPLPQRL